MTDYLARLGTPEGEVFEQKHRAVSAEALRRELEAKGLHVFRLRPVGRRARLPFLGARERISPMEFLVFNQQLATLLRAGIPVLQSLELLQGAQSSPFFRSVLSRVLEEVKSGVALSEAFLAQGSMFPRLYGATLMAGERSGELESVLTRYIHHQQMLESVRRKVSSALTYPLVLVGLAFGLIVLLVTYVIPRFAGFFIGFAAQLPLPTLIVIATANWFQSNILFVAGVAVAAFWLVRRWLRSENGRLAWDGAKMKVPFVGEIFHLFGLSQFVRSLATLVAGGTPLVNALEVATSTITNRAISGPMARVAPRVREGQALWASLEATGLFPELSVAMVKVGEATGALEEMLFNVGQFYDESIEVRLGRVVSLIEPAVLVLMGGVIAALLLSVYLPMFSLLQHAR
ncbi:MAG: type II secretion system F family protein [Acidobacteriota bacterium]